jgi:hypothetical protein
MAALTGDVKIIEYGIPDGGQQLIPQPLPANTTVYRGSIALTNGPNSSVSPGYIKNAHVPTSTDVCWGVLSDYAGGTAAALGPGMTGGTGISCNIQTGAFFLASGSGADQLSQSTVGQTVYVIDEVTVGATSGSGTRPVAGVHLAVDPTQASTLFAIKLGSTSAGGV